MEITGLDHIYISVSDFPKSEQFYDAAMGAFGFKKGDKPIADAPHAHYFNRHLQYTIRPACTISASRLRTERVSTAPTERSSSWRSRWLRPPNTPEYNDDYYAIFFEDLDGLRLEVLARSRYRHEIVDRWDELTVFTNPIAELRAREKKQP